MPTFLHAVARAVRHSLGRRIAIYILMFSSVVTLFSTGLQLALEYRRDVAEVESQLSQIQSSYSDSLAGSLWTLNQRDMQLQLNGILRLPDMQSVEVRNERGQRVAQAGRGAAPRTVEREVALRYRHRERDLRIGSVRFVASLEGAEQRLKDKVAVILVSQTIKTFLVSLFILFLFVWLVGRHLKRIALHSATVGSTPPVPPLALERTPGAEPDELDQLVSAINGMDRRLQQALHGLRDLNEQLEDRVGTRTAELRLAMEQIVETEKLASLGRLVAGVAHELNTPLGNVLLTATTLADHMAELSAKMRDGTLRRSELDSGLQSCTNATGVISRNALRANQLIESFKRVAVDQSSQCRRQFDLLATVQDIANTMGTATRQANAHVTLLVPPGIVLDSFPGHLEQILSNLIANSIRHGFEGRGGGCITISATERGGTVTLVYEDDGNGIPKESQQKVFEPFYTTKLGQGGSGLGLSIVHNLTQAVFKGTLRLESEPGQGVRMTFTIPQVADQDILPPA